MQKLLRALALMSVSASVVAATLERALGVRPFQLAYWPDCGHGAGFRREPISLAMGSAG